MIEAFKLLTNGDLRDQIASLESSRLILPIRQHPFAMPRLPSDQNRLLTKTGAA